MPGPGPTSRTAASQFASRLRTQHRRVQRVVLAQALHVAGLEPGALDRGDDVADLVQLAVGEHVALGEAPIDERRRPPVVVLLARVVRDG